MYFFHIFLFVRRCRSRSVIFSSQDLVTLSNNKLVMVIRCAEVAEPHYPSKRRGPTVIYGPLLMRYRQQMFRYHMYWLSFIKYQRRVSLLCFAINAQPPTFYNVYTHSAVLSVNGVFLTLLSARILSPSYLALSAIFKYLWNNN